MPSLEQLCPIEWHWELGDDASYEDWLTLFRRGIYYNRPEVIYHAGHTLFERFEARMGKLRLVLLEAYARALLAVGAFNTADRLIREVEKRFPVLRSARLRAEWEEAMDAGRLLGGPLAARGAPGGRVGVARTPAARALERSVDALIRNGENVFLRRRVLSQFRAGSPEEGAAAAAKHLREYPHDAETWLCIALAHQVRREAGEAFYCFERLLLLLPEHPLANALYAESAAQLGLAETARKGFAAHVPATRACWGVLSTSMQLLAGLEVKPKTSKGPLRRGVSQGGTQKRAIEAKKTTTPDACDASASELVSLCAGQLRKQYTESNLCHQAITNYLTRYLKDMEELYDLHGMEVVV